MRHALFAATLALALFACTPFDPPLGPPAPIEPPRLDDAPIGELAERGEQKLEAVEQKIEQFVKRTEELPGKVRAVAFEEALDVWALEHHRANGEALDWRASLVDLLKLVGFDASRAGRRALATSFGRSRYRCTARENAWLHARVLEWLEGEK